jgi:Resolvase, N terminal domain
MIAAIYARKSTDQAGPGDKSESVERQLARARAYATRKGWIVADAHVYVDDGISGAEFGDRRPGLARLLNALRPRAGRRSWCGPSSRRGGPCARPRIGNMKVLRRRAAVAPFLVSVNPTYDAGLGRPATPGAEAQRRAGHPRSRSTAPRASFSRSSCAGP